MEQQQPPQETAAENTTENNHADSFPASWEDVFKHPRFKELTQRAKTAEEKLAQLQKEREEIEKKKLEEEKNFQELYKKAEEAAKQLEAENKRLKIAYKKGLPPTLIERMRGETEEDMEKDADELLALIGDVTKRGVPPPPRGGATQKVDLSTEQDPEKIRKYVKELTKR